MLAPPVPPRRRGRTVAVVTAAALLVVSGTAFGMARFVKGDEQASQQVAEGPEKDTSRDDLRGDPAPPHTVAPETPTADEPADEEPVDEEPVADGDGEPAVSDASLDNRTAHAPPRVREARPRAAGPPSEPTEPDPAPAGADGSLEDAIDRALEARSTPPKPSQPDLPAAPDRAEVASALRDVSSAVRACAPNESGIAKTRIVIEGPTGRVRGVNVSGELAGTKAGSCIARVIRSEAELPRFGRERLEVSFPYVL